MDSKGSYTPAEIAEILARHNATQLALIGLEDATNELIDIGRSQGGAQQAYVLRHTLSRGVKSTVAGLKREYERDVPEDIRKALDARGALPDFDLQIDKEAK